MSLLKRIKLNPSDAADLENAAAGAANNAVNIDDLMGAVCELAELAAEQDDALAELAGLIEDQQKGAEKWQKSTTTASKQVL